MLSSQKKKRQQSEMSQNLLLLSGAPCVKDHALGCMCNSFRTWAGIKARKQIYSVLESQKDFVRIWLAELTRPVTMHHDSIICRAKWQSTSVSIVLSLNLDSKQCVLQLACHPQNSSLPHIQKIMLLPLGLSSI